MQNDITAGIFAILDSVKADFPRRKREGETLIRQRGLKADLEIEIAPSPADSDDSHIRRK